MLGVKVNKQLFTLKTYFSTNMFQKRSRSIQPYIPQGHFRVSSMEQPKFISYHRMETWTLSIRTIVSNIGTTTYLAKYLAELLFPLSQSQYTVKSTKDFTYKIRNVNVSHGFNMISFDVKSLFTRVHLEETIVALDRIYHRKEIETSISKNNMRNLLLLCTKNIHFCFGRDIYQ